MTTTKRKFKTFYDTIGEKEGKIFKMPSLTNQDSEKEVNINTMIERYGMTTMMQKTKPDEEMYIDLNFYDNMSVNDIVKMQNNMEEYFNNLPSKIRKEFGDDFDTFYQKFQKGNFDEFVEKGIVSEETVKEINRIQKEKKDRYIADLTEKYKIQEKARLLAEKEVGEQKNEN